jgi:hypothetical protein
MASIRSQQGFYTIIVRGLPDDVFDTLDAGPVRSLAEVLTKRGEKNATTLAAALQKIWVYNQRVPQIRTARGSHSELLRLLEDNPDIRNCVNYSIAKVRGIIPGAVGTASHYLGARFFDRNAADDFVDRLFDGIELKRNDPVLQLRERMLKDRRNRKTEISETEKWALTIKAMNASFQQEQVKLLVWRPTSGESFPRVLGDADELRNAA